MDEFEDLVKEDDKDETPATAKTAPKAKAKTATKTAKTAPKAKTATKKAAPKAKTAKAGGRKVVGTLVAPKDRDKLPVGTVLVYAGKFGDHKLKIIKAPKALVAKRPEAKVAYQLDGKKWFSSTSAAAITVMGTTHGNGWAFWKLPAKK